VTTEEKNELFPRGIAEYGRLVPYSDKDDSCQSLRIYIADPHAVSNNILFSDEMLTCKSLLTAKRACRPSQMPEISLSSPATEPPRSRRESLEN